MQADLRDPGMILQEAALTLDFARPAAVSLVSILQLISDEDHPHGIVARFMGSVPPGSYLVHLRIIFRPFLHLRITFGPFESFHTAEKGRKMIDRWLTQL